MRLIDADALANYANNQIVGITANDIMRFPTVDAEPVKHGRWNPIETTGIYFIKVECSTCDALIDYIEPRADNYIICPWCGSINGR